MYIYMHVTSTIYNIIYIITLLKNVRPLAAKSTPRAVIPLTAMLRSATSSVPRPKLTHGFRAKDGDFYVDCEGIISKDFVGLEWFYADFTADFMDFKGILFLWDFIGIGFP